MYVNYIWEIYDEIQKKAVYRNHVIQDKKVRCLIQEIDGELQRMAQKIKYKLQQIEQDHELRQGKESCTFYQETIENREYFKNIMHLENSDSENSVYLGDSGDSEDEDHEDFLSELDFWHHPELMDLKDRLLAVEGIERLLVSSLFDAIKKNKIEMIQFLQRVGVSVHARDEDNQTTLHVAASYHQPDALEWMISEGVDLMAANDWHQTPLNVISERIFSSGEDYWFYTDYIKCEKILIRYMVLSDCKESDYITRRPCYISDIQYEKHMNRLMSFRHQCRIELECMKKKDLGRGVTLYDIVTSKNPSSYLRDETIRRALDRHSSQIYGDVIKAKFQKGLERLNALRVGEIVLSHIEGLIPDVAFRLSEYLSNEDIERLRKAAVQILNEPVHKRKATRKKRVSSRKKRK